MGNPFKIKSLLKKRSCKDQAQSDSISDLLAEKELLVYNWHLMFSDLGHHNSWSRISSKISDTSPIMVKNFFYSTANSTLRRISLLKSKFESRVEKIRTAFFLFLYLQYLPKLQEDYNDHFQSIVRRWHLSFEELSMYAKEAKINWTKEELLKELNSCMKSLRSKGVLEIGILIVSHSKWFFR